MEHAILPQFSVAGDETSENLQHGEQVNDDGNGTTELIQRGVITNMAKESYSLHTKALHFFICDAV